MRHLSIAAVLTTLILGLAPAQADERDEAVAAMKGCQAITADSVRLVCMDAAAKLLGDLSKVTPEVQAPVPSTERPIATSPSVAEESARAAADLEAERARLITEREALKAEREAVAKERTELAEAEKRAEPESRRIGGGLLSAPRGLGLFKSDDRPKRYETSVTKIVVNNLGRHFFYTDDGTTWRQVPPAALTAPSSLPAKVTIRRTASGARRLAFEEHPSKSYVIVETNAD